MRRIAECRAALELSLEERLGVVAGGERERAHGGVERLDDHASPRGPRPLRPASCATSANVRSSARKSESAGWHRRRAPAERHVRKVVPLRDHLRSNEHSRRRLLEAAEHGLHTLAGRAVGVEPEDR